jgi:hypothetical protein
MFQQQEHVGNVTRPALVDELPLQLERLAVGDAAEPPHLETPHV